MGPELGVRIVEMRCAHPGWAPRTILFWLDRVGMSAVSRANVGRALSETSRAGDLAGVQAERSHYKRWERSRAMELWQMDIRR